MMEMTGISFFLPLSHPRLIGERRRG